MGNFIQAVPGITKDIGLYTDRAAAVRGNHAAFLSQERHVMSLRVGQCINILPITRDLAIATVLIITQPLLSRLVAALPAFPYQTDIVWALYAIAVSVPILHALYRVAYSAATRIEISNQALRLRRGVFNHHHDHLALFRFRDYQIDRPLIQRLCRRGIVIVYAADQSKSMFRLPAVKHPVQVAEVLNQLATQARAIEGVHVIE